MVQITDEQFQKILYFLNQVMDKYGYGEEYNKIVELLKTLPLNDTDLSEFYKIDLEIVRKPKFHDIDIKKLN